MLRAARHVLRALLVVETSAVLVPALHQAYPPPNVASFPRERVGAQITAHPPEIVGVALRHARYMVPDSPRPLVVLTFANDEYRSTLVNWMAGLHRLGVANFQVICMDDTISELMTSIGRPCASLKLVGEAAPSGDTDMAVWAFRLRVLVGLLEKGTDIVLSDADAVWLQNPFPFLATGDIVVSRGGFPAKIVNQLGAAACLGWAFFRGTPDVARFTRDQIVARFNGDDQATVNRALVDNGLRFEPKTTFENSTEVVEGKAGGLTVKFLDHRRFRRRCNGNWTGVYVAHCLSGKRGGSKVRRMMMGGLWFLKEGWEEQKPDGNFTAWMDSISAGEPYVAWETRSHSPRGQRDPRRPRDHLVQAGRPRRGTLRQARGDPLPKRAAAE